MALSTPAAWAPSPEQAEGSRLRSFLRSLDAADVAAVNAIALRDPERFWAAVSNDIGIDWTRRFDRAVDTSQGLPWARFWVGGRLNLAHSAVYRWAATSPDRTALVWEGDNGSTRQWTYAELAAETGRAAAVLAALGVGEGDAVGLCMPMVPETAAIFLACAQLGAIVVPLFSGYGAGAIVARLQDCDAKVLCVVDGFLRRGGLVRSKPTADEAAEQLPALQHILVVPRSGADVACGPGGTTGTSRYRQLCQQPAGSPIPRRARPS